MRRAIAAIVIGVLMAAGCTFNSGGGAAANPAYQEQVDAFNRQTEQADALLAEQVKRSERSDRLLVAQEEAFDRYMKVLAKWEDQARRMDAVLDAQEKQAGIKGKDSPP